MAEGLKSYLGAARRREFRWGLHDCALFCADWVWQVTGFDVGATWRGKYDTEAGAQEFIDAAGGLVALFDQGTDGVLERCDPSRAQVGVIDTERGQAGAIRSGSFWVVLTEGGQGRVRIDRAVCLAAWGF
jgi:hypothetical protein